MTRDQTLGHRSGSMKSNHWTAGKVSKESVCVENKIIPPPIPLPH